METHLNERTSYFSKPFSCCVSSIHSLGKYFPQGPLVFFSESTSSAHETDLDSCHEREYTGWYFRGEVLVVKDLNFSLHCFSSSDEPYCTCWSGEKRIVFLSTKSFSEQIAQLVLAPVIFSSTGFAGIDPPSHLDAGTEHKLSWPRAQTVLPPSASHPSLCLPLFSHPPIHPFIPCATIYSQISPQIAPVLLFLHDEIQLQPQVSPVFCNYFCEDYLKRCVQHPSEI